ncbi:MAG: 5'/3'-nucleotidase SurE [Candidatus Lindowbacteria bacterium RIFCSPLOWO2_12_FULL_62_27]|nr:MAG: 5'/3'-nucleotidase SurE [Candidatus Lindowbacteria bacterium RIFCSPLOWO2_02_FULL_62_12]OGH60818.1 MAG: 5'/3'-nucleotidase SurE [Candidatus Lindowbacteria bacterium RIFCSPLOWO2_12_FULL_62_27]
MRTGVGEWYLVNAQTVVLTNDDGIFAAGLQALARALRAAGYRPVVVAPDRGASGASRSLSLHRPLTVRRLGEDQYAVDGTPTDCVMMAIFEILKNRRPSLLLSGINHGQNLADDVTYSGTCAAAAEGCMEGIPSVAISALTGRDGEFYFDDHADFFVQSVLPSIGRLRIPRWSFINVNFPPRPAARIRGVRVVPLGRSTYSDPIARRRAPQALGRSRKGWIYWIVGEPKSLKKRGTDIEAIERGCVSLTPIHLDLTDRRLLAECRKLFP